VLKIKPPMPFNKSDVDMLIRVLSKVLQEDYVLQSIKK